MLTSPNLIDGFSLEYFQLNRNILGFKQIYPNLFKLKKFNSLIKIHYQSNNNFFYSESENIVVLTRGDIYLNKETAESLIAKFKTTNFTHFLNKYNCYLLLFVNLNSESITILSDHFSSKKVFYSCNKHSIFISTNLSSFSTQNYNISKKGLAWYLTNGTTINSNTIFQNIYQSQGSQKLIITYNKIQKDFFWTLKFNPVKISKSEAKYHLKTLLKTAIIQSQNKESDSFISLSGGYDISAIAGLLKCNNPEINFQAVSYHYNSCVPESDSHVAKKQAKLLGINYTGLQSYNTFKDYVKLNSSWGDYRANLCDESYFWETLYKNNFCSEIKSLYTGEEFFGWNNSRSKNKLYLIKNLGINNSENLKFINNLLSKNTRLMLNQNVDFLFKEILDSIPEYENSLDTLMHGYFYYNIPYVLMPWRELFAGRIFQVKMPWLNNDIINFITQLPYPLRTNKRLFKECIHEIMPVLFNIKRASISNNVPDWSKEINNNKQSITQSLKSSCILDKYISQEEIHSLLNQSYAFKKSNRRKRIGEKIYHKYPILGKFTNKILGPTQLQPNLLLRRILTLRTALNNA